MKELFQLLRGVLFIVMAFAIVALSLLFIAGGSLKGIWCMVGVTAVFCAFLHFTEPKEDSSK